MTAYQFSQPWLAELNGDNAMAAMEFANLRKYLKGLDDGTTSLFNLNLQNLTLLSPLTVTNGGTGLATLTSGSYLKGAGTSNVSLQAPPIPIADGGTNSTTALNSNRVIIASGGKIVEQSALTANRIIIADSNGLPVSTGAGALNGNLSFVATSTQGIVGSVTNDTAASGNVGEYVESVVGSTSFPSTGQYGDATSISLTAGDWDMTAGYVFTNPGTTSLSELAIGISTTSGNNTTGLVYGSNRFAFQQTTSATTPFDYPMSVIPYRVSLSGTTTHYLKFEAVYTVATPSVRGARLSARRVR